MVNDSYTNPLDYFGPFDRWNVLQCRVKLPLPIDVGMMSSILPTVLHRAYCTTVGGVQGCCKLGHVCNQILDQCTANGQKKCPNDNFCCGEHSPKPLPSFPSSPMLTRPKSTQAAGATCYRDVDNYPRCTSRGTSTMPSGISVTLALTFLLSLLRP